MFPILLLATLLFWIIPILQTSLFPWWSGDGLLILIFIWSFYVLRKSSELRFSFWHFISPFVLGLGFSKFVFFSPYYLFPYVVFVVAMTYLLFAKRKWAFRPKEGLIFILFAFIVYTLSYIAIKTLILGYSLDYHFWIKISITYFSSVIIWALFMLRGGRGKIR